MTSRSSRPGIFSSLFDSFVFWCVPFPFLHDCCVPVFEPATSKSLPSSRDTQTEVEEVKPFISVFKMDSIVSRVQEMLKVEQEELQSDVDYLQRCIEEEVIVNKFVLLFE